MNAREAELGAYVVDTGLLSRADFTRVVERAADTGEALLEALSSSGMLGEDEVRRAHAHVLGIPFVMLDAENISPDALILIPEPFSRTHGIVAYGLSEDLDTFGKKVLEVAFLNTANYEQVRALYLPYTLRIRVTDRASMTRALLLYQKILKNSFPNSFGESSALDSLLERALYSLAESVYIDPTEVGFIVRYRIMGELYEASTLSPSVGSELLTRVHSFAHPHFKIIAGDEEVMVHISTLSTTYGETVALRLARSGGAAEVTLQSLGLHGSGLSVVHRVLARRSGLVMVVGQTQDQISALLYTMLETVSGHTQRTVSVEERIARRLTGALQTEAGDGHSISTAAGVRAALLQDPDVLMVSSVSDRETALLVVEAANRGVFVLAGITASSAAKGLETLLSFGVSSLQLAAVLAACVGTSSLKQLCASCAPLGEPYRFTRSEMSELEGNINFARVLMELKESGVRPENTPWKDISFMHPQGCEACQGNGYKGTLSVHEVLPGSLTIKEALRVSENAETIEKVARAEGVLTRLEDAIYKASIGQTSIEEAFLLEA